MKEEYQKQLVEVWKDDCLELTFDSWMCHMEKFYKRVITDQLPELARNIATDSGLFSQLQSKKVFDRRVLETLEQKQGKYAQISAVLNTLSSKPFENFIGFCESLIESHQIHIIRDYLTPLGIGVRTVQAQPVEDQGSGIATLPPCEERTAVSTPRRIVDFEWRNSIKISFPDLVNQIEPDSGLIDELVRRGVISSTTVDVYTSIKGRSNRVEAILNHLRVSRPDEDFIEFCEALCITNQGHIVEQYLTKDSFHRESSLAQSSSQPAPRLDLKLPPHISGSVHHLSKDDGWKTALINRRSQIIDKIDVSNGLINKLRSFGVLNQTTAERCQDEQNVVKRAELLIDYMYRRSHQDFALLCQALYETGQDHVVDSVLLQLDCISTSDGS